MVPTQSPAAGEPGRRDRRKARTRTALLSAAQELLAADRTEVSIQEITDRADACDELAEQLLIMFGLPRRTAHAVAHRPLPAQSLAVEV